MDAKPHKLAMVLDTDAEAALLATIYLVVILFKVLYS